MDLGGDRVEKSIKTLTAEIIKHAGENQGLQDFRGPNFSSQPDVCGFLGSKEIVRAISQHLSA